MSVDFLQRQIQSTQQEVARLQEQKARAAADAASDMRRAHDATESASRALGPTTAQARTRDATRFRDNAVRHQKRVAELESRIAREQSKLSELSRRLVAAQSTADQRRQAERSRAEREHEMRLRTISGQLSDHDALHRVALSAIRKMQQLPEQIAVLFLASNPIDQPNLRLDEEARAIQAMIRSARHRDSVRFESRWALQPLDLLQALNEVQPRVVHFSGHGSDQDQIVFQDDEGETKLVSKEAIVSTMAAVSGNIQLVFFNTCYSRSQAEAVVQRLPAAIGMNTSIGDRAARVFSAQFYSAIGFGLSVKAAFEQAKAALLLESIPEEDTPELFVAEGLNPEELVLVRPPQLAVE